MFIDIRVCLLQMLSMLAHIGPPTLSTNQDDCSILQGLTKAIEMLTTPTPMQSEILRGEEEILNTGRIICVTAFKRYYYCGNTKGSRYHTMDGVGVCGTLHGARVSR